MYMLVKTYGQMMNLYVQYMFRRSVCTSQQWLLLYPTFSENDGLSGELVPELSVLSSMRFLILEQGDIAGPSPETLYDLSSLQQLDLSDNQITGSISSKIGDLQLLEEFRIDHNSLFGTIPDQMGQLNNLRIGVLSANDIEGVVPDQVCALRNNTDPPGVLGVLVTDCVLLDISFYQTPCWSSCVGIQPTPPTSWPTYV